MNWLQRLRKLFGARTTSVRTTCSILDNGVWREATAAERSQMSAEIKRMAEEMDRVVAKGFDLNP